MRYESGTKKDSVGIIVEGLAGELTHRSFALTESAQLIALPTFFTAYSLRLLLKTGHRNLRYPGPE